MAALIPNTKETNEMKKLVSSILLTAALTASAIAQTASDAAKGYFSTYQKKEYGKSAEYFHPEALDLFRQMLSFGKSLPEEKATAFYTGFFGPEATKESIEKLDNQAYFSQFIGSIMKRILEPANVEYGKVEVLGEVKEGEVTHVLVRLHLSSNGVESQAMEVISFKQYKGEWKTLLTEKFESIAESLQENFR
ncbi:hypothetical protein Rhal01_03738 [Rubritalea halochordaticola]|uniref:Uncharacterized protein n=2 Tax=Rubritalea halochordaticola TaxID=714537 RepID=A0ABP9VA94_9BACT